MKLLLHILRKDARRLWLPLGVTLVLLGVLAHDDGWRSDSMPGLAEGWLNLLLPLAWALLAALAVHEESLVGDREFWTTRPYRRTALAGAKVVSLLLAIHVPSFLADCAILLVRGFNPLEWMPQLLGKQLLLACWLTIPAAALATVVGSIAHFMLAALAIAAGAAFLGGTLDRFSAPWRCACEHGSAIAVAAARNQVNRIIAACIIPRLRWAGALALVNRDDCACQACRGTDGGA